MLKSSSLAVLVATALALAVYAGSTTAATAKPVIRSQAACSGASGWCLEFGPGDAPLTVRHFKFSVPSAGRASVSFTGSLSCGNTLGFGNRYVSLDSQIVGTATASASAGGAGGLRHFVVLGASSSDTFSLASTRVFSYSAGGDKHVYLRISEGEMDSDILCSVYDAAFSVVFVP